MYNLSTASRKDFMASLPSDFKIGAEVGVSHGDFSKNILEVRPSTLLYCIDCWEENYQLPDPQQALEETKANLAPYPGQYVVIKSPSKLAAKQFTEGALDFVYIDADHTYASVLEDMITWYPKIRSGGILCGHDYTPTWQGVVDAVDEFCKNNDYSVEVVKAMGYFNGDQDGGAPSWWIVVR